jgi:hypothetical protein
MIINEVFKRYKPQLTKNETISEIKSTTKANPTKKIPANSFSENSFGCVSFFSETWFSVDTVCISSEGMVNDKTGDKGLRIFSLLANVLTAQAWKQ